MPDSAQRAATAILSVFRLRTLLRARWCGGGTALANRSANVFSALYFFGTVGAAENAVFRRTDDRYAFSRGHAPGSLRPRHEAQLEQSLLGDGRCRTASHGAES